MTRTAPIVIIGADGMLGRTLVDVGRARGQEVIAFDDPCALDITRVDHLERLPTRCAAVINAAAYTDVDGAETDEANALRVNGDGPGLLAERCDAIGVPLVHYSTDYVFAGSATTPIPTDAPTDPINAYGRTKLAGEQAIRAAGTEHLILRTSWLFAPHGDNFVTTMRRLGRTRDVIQVVNDQRGRPTSCRTLATVTFDLLDREVRGTLHATNDGEATWYDLAVAVMETAGLDCRVEPCGSDLFPRPAPRPAYSVLALDETIRALGSLPPWRTALGACLAIDAPVRP